MKRILVKLGGSDREPYEVHLQPGLTGREVLGAIGLDERMLLCGPEGLAIDSGAELWSAVEDGDMLFAVLLECVY